MSKVDRAADVASDPRGRSGSSRPDGRQDSVATHRIVPEGGTLRGRQGRHRLAEQGYGPCLVTLGQNEIVQGSALVLMRRVGRLRVDTGGQVDTAVIAGPEAQGRFDVGNGLSVIGHLHSGEG